MLENISRKISPQEEQETINLMTNFGWRLISSQEINNTDSHIEERYGELYSVTTRENYVKLLFQRDTSRRNYAYIVQLEKAYYKLLNEKPEFSKEIMTIGIIVGILTIFIMAIPGILIIYKYYRKYKNEYIQWMNKMNTIGVTILNEAQSLL